MVFVGLLGVWWPRGCQKYAKRHPKHQKTLPFRRLFGKVLDVKKLAKNRRPKVVVQAPKVEPKWHPEPSKIKSQSASKNACEKRAET